MSHEIRTPMNAILGISQIQLQKENLPPEHNAAMEMIYSSGGTMLSIINDLLDLTKIEAGKMELNPAGYDSANFINDVVRLNIIRIESKPVEFILDADENLPRKMYGDELRLKQILNNLISNAIKYTGQGYVKLTVNHSLEGGDVILSFIVEDTGQGIKNEDQKNLYLAYSRFDTAADRGIEGTGIGLNITKSLVEMMGGSISVESEYGKGSIFTVKVRQKPVECDAIGAEIARKLRDFTFAGEKKFSSAQIPPQDPLYGKVLVVDDVRANLYVARGFLSPYKLKIETAGGGHAAIDKINQGGTYDIIFMDHMMPAPDGVETTRKLRAAGYTGVIIALTANVLAGSEKMFKENGFDDFLSKPLDARQLDDCLKKHLRSIPENFSAPEQTSIGIELEKARLDTLNHFRYSFDNLQKIEHQAKIDTAYFEKFTALIKSFDTDDLAPDMKKQAALLQDAAMKGDAQKIQETLGVFIEALQNKADDEERNDSTLGAMVSRLKKAAEEGQSRQADSILAEMGAIRLNRQERELYFLLYDLLLSGDSAKAAGAISLWEKLRYSGAV
jgi:CheY-like chemotaxis protein